MTKLVLFAHTPPPHHGQSYMVQLALEALGGDARRIPSATAAEGGPSSASSPSSGFRCYHVNCRLSAGLEDIGQARGGKLLPLLRYCLAAIWLRLRHGADHFYYVPASACRLGLVRDWIIMGLCRPFFRKIICHWHATGLGSWLRDEARPWERRISRWLLFRPHLSIVLGEHGRRDAEAVESRRVVVVPNGIPDPVPEFDHEVLPGRQARAAARARAATADGTKQVFSVLYLGLCCREKGLFDTMEGVALANRQLAERKSLLRVRLQVAGTFWRRHEEEEFRKRLEQPDLMLERTDATAGSSVANRTPAVHYLGFVSGETKQRLLAESDCFCFPTYYASEGFPLVLLEAMAYGLPIISTRWRSIPELLPPGYAGLIEPRAPAQVAAALLALLNQPCDRALRDRYLTRYTREQFAQNLAAALRG